MSKLHRQRTLVLLAGLCVFGANGAAAAFPETDWAFPKLSRPGPEAAPSQVRSVSVEGSTVHHSEAELANLHEAVDWWPEGRAPMPKAVRLGGGPDAFACGFCHLPNGQGRPENAALAGLSAPYISQEVEDFKNGSRVSAHLGWAPTELMIKTARATTRRDVAEAAVYFSKMPFKSRVRVEERVMIPRSFEAGAVYRFSIEPDEEPLGQRIVEGPIDFEQFEKRDERTSFIAYVPTGAVARGRILATTGGQGRTQACDACHAEGLKGAIGPQLAGRSPTYLFRQLLAFNSGARRNPEAMPMTQVTAQLTVGDMIDLASYAASLNP